MTATTESPAKTADANERGPVGAPLIKRFDEIGIDDIPLVGGKNASLGEMRRERENSRRDHLRQTASGPRAGDPECVQTAFCGSG
jgi:hypothetical protein